MPGFFSGRKKTQFEINQEYADAYAAIIAMWKMPSANPVDDDSDDFQKSELAFNQQINGLKNSFIIKILEESKKITNSDPEKKPLLTKTLIAAQQALDYPSPENINTLISASWAFRRGSDAFTGITLASSGLALALMVGGFAAVAFLAPPVGGIILSVGAVVSITAVLCVIFHRLSKESRMEALNLANEARGFGHQLKTTLGI
jgi:hypothetical protein